MRRSVLCMMGIVGTGSFAQVPPDDVQALFGLSLEQLAQVRVESASLVRMALSRTPAIVTVLHREDLEAWGDRSVGDALARVPGFYRVDAHGMQDVGVRGLFGGQRSWNRQLKVMIDGQPLPFRPDSTNFLGPELIPMGAVDRIEIVRGPTSALYGADAFLATINIITRKELGAEKGVHLHLRTYAGMARGVEAKLSGGHEHLGFLVAAQVENQVIDDLCLPASSPLLAAQPALRGVASKDARQRPVSFLGQVGYETGALRHDLAFTHSRMDAVAEFLDFGVLNPANRWSQSLSQVGWQTQWNLSPAWQAKVRLNLSDAGPSSRERLDVGSTAFYPKREFSSRAREVSLTVNWAPSRNHLLALGADRVEDRQQSLQILRVLPNGATSLSGRSGVALTLVNSGVFAQYLLQASDRLALTLNWRGDEHSTYGSNQNWRLAAVYELNRQWNAKLIWSTSYKAPSVFDLMAQPLYNGDVVGNANLRPETARNAEFQVNWHPLADLQVSANVYQLTVTDKIDLQQTGLNYQPVNRGRLSGHGLEVDVCYDLGGHRLGLNWTDQHLREHFPMPLVGDQIRPPERFPDHLLRLDWRWKHRRFGQWASELVYASRRHASFSNGFANFMTPYSLGSSTRVNAVWTGTMGAHELQARVENALHARYSETGYGAVDLPGRGRSLTLGYRFKW